MQLQNIVNASVKKVKEITQNNISDEKTAVENEFKNIKERVGQMNEKISMDN